VSLTSIRKPMPRELWLAPSSSIFNGPARNLILRLYRNLVKFCANGFVDIGKAIDNGIDERLENSLSRSELFCLGVDWMSYSGKKSTTVVI
jgi:hypothetical protein